MSPNGFYGTPCDSYFAYLLGMCNQQQKVIGGDECPRTAKGMYYVDTNDIYPYAKGEGEKLRVERRAGRTLRGFFG